MIRVKTAKRLPRFYRGGIEFGRGWLTLTEPGDPGDSVDLTAEQASAIRAETRFLDVEEIEPAKAKRIVSPNKFSSGSSGRVADPVPPGTGETSSKNTQRGGDDPSGSAPAGSSDPTGDEAKPNGKEPELVNVNTASAAQIAEAANGIGPATARDLVKWRTANGPFAQLDELTRVGGIGNATVARNRDRLTV